MVNPLIALLAWIIAAMNTRLTVQGIRELVCPFIVAFLCAWPEIVYWFPVFLFSLVIDMCNTLQDEFDELMFSTFFTDPQTRVSHNADPPINAFRICHDSSTQTNLVDYDPLLRKIEQIRLKLEEDRRSHQVQVNDLGTQVQKSEAAHESTVHKIQEHDQKIKGLKSQVQEARITNHLITKRLDKHDGGIENLDKKVQEGVNAERSIITKLDNHDQEIGVLKNRMQEGENAASSAVDKIGEVEKGLEETKNEVQAGAESMGKAIELLRDELKLEKERAAEESKKLEARFITTVRGLQARLDEERKAPQYMVEELETARRRHFKAVDDMNKARAERDELREQLWELRKETKASPVEVTGVEAEGEAEVVAEAVVQAKAAAEEEVKTEEEVETEKVQEVERAKEVEEEAAVEDEEEEEVEWIDVDLAKRIETEVEQVREEEKEADVELTERIEAEVQQVGEEETVAEVEEAVKAEEKEEAKEEAVAEEVTAAEEVEEAEEAEEVEEAPIYPRPIRKMRKRILPEGMSAQQHIEKTSTHSAPAILQFGDDLSTQIPPLFATPSPQRRPPVSARVRKPASESPASASGSVTGATTWKPGDPLPGLNFGTLPTATPTIQTESASQTAPVPPTSAEATTTTTTTNPSTSSSNLLAAGAAAIAAAVPRPATALVPAAAPTSTAVSAPTTIPAPEAASILPTAPVPAAAPFIFVTPPVPPTPPTPATPIQLPVRYSTNVGNSPSLVMSVLDRIGKPGPRPGGNR